MGMQEDSFTAQSWKVKTVQKNPFIKCFSTQGKGDIVIVLCTELHMVYTTLLPTTSSILSQCVDLQYGKPSVAVKPMSMKYRTVNSADNRVRLSVPTEKANARP